MSWLQRNRKLQLGLLLLAPFVLAAIIPGQLAPHRPDALLDTPFLPPSWHYLLGTDESGRDILSRLIFSARADLGISLSATLIASPIPRVPPVTIATRAIQALLLLAHEPMQRPATPQVRGAEACRACQFQPRSH